MHSRHGPSLQEAFDRRHNGLNMIRLVLALGVIVWHSYPLTGRDIAFEPARQLLGEVFVDGFFAVSGFLITMSWLRRPQIAEYLRSRALRILPAFYVCLATTAFVFAPIAARTGHGSMTAADSWTYIFGNALLRITQRSVGSTPAGVPYEAVWNGSLWTLYYEALCYLLVLVVGVIGLLRYPRLASSTVFLVGLLSALIAHTGLVQHYLVTVGGRFLLMFAAGMVIYAFADVVPIRASLLVLAAGLVLLSSFLPDYRIVSSLFLAYLVLGLGALMRHPRWNLRNDLSYGTYIYAFPVQQGLAMAGLASSVPLAAFALLSGLLTIPFAAASWWLVERPALRLRHSASASGWLQRGLLSLRGSMRRLVASRRVV